MELTQESLVRFLREVDKDFHPPLSEKTDLKEYVAKILEKAMLFYELSDSGDIKGLVIMYANDFEKKYAYIPLVAVSPLYRKQGVVYKLLGESLQYLNTLKGEIQVLGIHTNNPVALVLYQKMGFKSVETVNGRTYLELKL